MADEPAAVMPTSGESVQPAPRSRRPLRQTVMEDADNIITRNEQTSRFLDRFLFCTNQLFNIVDNQYFHEFVDAVKKAHPSWMPYKRDEARTKRLDGHYGRTKVDVHAMVKKWHGSGCMLQMDGWSDRRNRPYINVMVSSPIGTIGEEAVVGVVMDNARVCVKAGKMVEAAYPRIFRVGCTAYALDLALKNMYKELEWLCNVVDTGLKEGKFFHKADKARALFHVYSPKSKLKRPGVTRFATNHEMLESLKKAKNPLKNCIDDDVRVEKMVRTDQFAVFHERLCGGRLTAGSWTCSSHKQSSCLAKQAPPSRMRADLELARAYFRAQTYKVAAEEAGQVGAQQLERPVAGGLGGDGGHVHIRWEDDTPVEAKIREWYNTWTAMAIDPAAVAADADVVAEDVEVGEEDGSEPLMRTCQRNDVADDEECDEEDMALLGS
ncbi:hypothetical protein CBR_g48648 [Chara braunii]|uniref:DUF659 domain-containing protein n=1 Tax=Chara braunii TaxID=69332 RepID=A0A388M382_CHABU|nr:hypothetical protein CBR_g48648 [Chara braunii]|eukprot:GBG89040.1 hypothetical protein CBR_g48648 [Chara braunii]